MSKGANHPKRKTPADKKSTSRPFLTKRRVQEALPLIDAGLSFLSGVGPVAPYAKALRVATSMGVSLMPHEHDSLLSQMKEVRTKIKELELRTESEHAVKVLRIQMDAFVDLLLDRVK